MRIIAICGSDGEIVALLTAPEDGVRPSVPGLPPTQQEIEIDVADLEGDADDATVVQRLTDLGARYRVDVDARQFTAR